ncbi:MAG TPA: hexokinase [Candidatus Atribacteria bacterium]|nr:hexokinase [Candidatus Atribacteria bacterium]HPT78138.1 hexokinase [Candidatus Atribacteria bacterium]
MGKSAIWEKVQDFMKENRMHHEQIDFDKELKVFLEDMENGLNGRESTLEMLPTYISLGSEIKTNERVIVMDAGGTNFRVATVYFDDSKKPVIEDFSNHPMPGTKGEISRDEFFETILEYIKPVIDKSDKIGFCFSYPTEILPNGDGKAIRFSKEIRVRDMIGEPVGGRLLEAAKKAGYKGDKQIVLLNDTVSTLLGGRATHPDKEYSSYVGFILGTGTNTCYIEDTANIGKIRDKNISMQTMLINMESGGYCKAPTGVVDDEFDSTTVNPGQARFEKMISGGYLGGLMLALLKKAASEGLLSKAFRENIDRLETLGAIDADAFLRLPYGNSVLSACCSTDPEEGRRDRETLYHLLDSVIERAAKLVTISLTGVVTKTGKGTDPCLPVCITADGSTFYMLKSMKEKIEYYVKKHMVEERGLYIEFVKAENPNLIGSAIAALSR